MRAVVDDAGQRSILLQENGEQALVRDVSTGRKRTVSLDHLATHPGGPLETLADALPTPLPTPLDRASSDRAQALLLELHLAGPRPVRALLSDTTLCESDLHGVVGDLRAAGLVAETVVGGERGYGLTGEASIALSTLG